MAKKKIIDVYATKEVAKGTNNNDVFHIKTDDVNTTIRTTVATCKVNAKGKVSVNTTVMKGSDVLYIEGLKTTDVDALTMAQQVDAEGNKTRNLDVTTNDGRTIIIEDYFIDTSGKATKSPIKSIRAEYPEAEGWHSSLTEPQCKDFLITDMCAIDCNGVFIPKKNKVIGSVFNDTIDMSGNTNKLTINGGLGNDIITGGKANDVIVGGKGKNVFVYKEGSGNDTVKLTKGEKLVIKYITGNSNPEFDVKESGKDVVISRTYKGLNGKTQTDTITVANMGKNNLAESVVFEYGPNADNTSHVYDLVNDVYVISTGKTKINGTNLKETIYGTTTKDTIKGAGGNDTIIADVGNDVIYGGAGIDTFVSDTYECNGKYYGSGKDTICDIQEGEILEFKNSYLQDIKCKKSDNDLVISYFDKDSTDTLENAVTIKNYYKNTPNLVIKALDAQGELSEYSTADILSGTVALEYGLKFKQLNFSKNGDDLVISSKKLKKNETVKDFFTSEDPISSIKTADSDEPHSLIQDMMVNVSSVQNGDGNYVGEGTKYNDIITGTANNDEVIGGKGNDVLIGGKGSDTFIFNKGDGVDTIKDAEKSDVIHINGSLDNLVFTRVNNDLEIDYSFECVVYMIGDGNNSEITSPPESKIVLSNFFKNKSENNVDLIKNLSGEIQLEYEDYINNPPYYESYYRNQYQRIYILKEFRSADGYDLCEKSILKDATIQVGGVNSYTGSDYKENVSVIGKNGKFDLGKGYDTLNFGQDYGKVVVTANKGETLNLRFTGSADFDYKISGNNLVLTAADGNVVTLKNYITNYKDVTVNINGSSMKNKAKYLEMLKVSADDFVKGKYTGTVLDENIDASGYVSTKQNTGVTINSKSGSDKIIGSDYNDIITASSLAGETANVKESAGVNKITTGSGNDIIVASGTSSNTINAGDGNNDITLSCTGTNNVTCGKNNDTLYITAGTNTVNTGDGIDSIRCCNGSNTINLGAGDDEIVCYSGNSYIDGGAGNDIFNFTYFDFNGSHYDVYDPSGNNKLFFDYSLIRSSEPQYLSNGMVMVSSYMCGRPFVFFDVAIGENGQEIMGDDILFTLSRTFSSFEDNGIHIIGKNSVSYVTTVGDSAALHISGGQHEEFYPVNGYHLDYTELTEKVANWLTSEANDSGYTTAMDVFTNGTNEQIAELASIYTANVDDCYQQGY
ncbi:MAG: hypothetical protein K6E29_03450 [Cyanobacteria bacterium RUI128]|nr:hypothetical protein [Cyanobacteria bacterium RUI128]